MNKKGFTLTELAIVLGVIGVVLGGIWAAASASFNSQKVDKAQQELITIVNNVRALYANRQGFAQGAMAANATVAAQKASAAALTLAMINAGVFPADMVDNSTSPPTVRSPWNTNVTINLGTIGGQTPDATLFWVDFASYTSDLPTNTCAAFLSRVAYMTNIGLVTVWDGVEYVKPQDVTESSFNNCSGDASFQFKLQS